MVHLNLILVLLIYTHRKVLIGFVIYENYFDSDGTTPPTKLSEFIIKRYGHWLCSEYMIQGLTNKRDSYCASYCLYVIYLTKVLSIDFKSAVLNLYYQRFS